MPTPPNNNRKTTMPLTPHRNSVVLKDRKTSNLYSTEDVDAILSDYAYFETFTGNDPDNRESTSSNYIAKRAKCYQNVRNQNTFLLVWYANDGNAQLEQLDSDELENLQVHHLIAISTSAHQIDQVHQSLSSIDKSKLYNTPNCDVNTEAMEFVERLDLRNRASREHETHNNNTDLLNGGKIK